MKKEFREFRNYLKKREVKLSLFIMAIIIAGTIFFGIRDKLKCSSIIIMVASAVVLTILLLLFTYLMERQDRRLIEQHNQQVRSQNKTGSH